MSIFDLKIGIFEQIFQCEKANLQIISAQITRAACTNNVSAKDCVPYSNSKQKAFYIVGDNKFGVTDLGFSSNLLHFDANLRAELLCFTNKHIRTICSEGHNRCG